MRREHTVFHGQGRDGLLNPIFVQSDRCRWSSRVSIQILRHNCPQFELLVSHLGVLQLGVEDSYFPHRHFARENTWRKGMHDANHRT